MSFQSRLIRVGNSEGVTIPHKILFEKNIKLGDTIDFTINYKDKSTRSQEGSTQTREWISKEKKKLLRQQARSKGGL